MGVGVGSPRRPRRRAAVAAFGPVLACRRALFLEHGDAPRVRSAVVEDVELARSIATAGEELDVYAGGGVVAFRMYEQPAHLVEGWTKNFASGARAVPLVRLLLIVGWITACLVSGAWLLGGSLAAVVVYTAYVGQCFVQLRQIGSFGVVTAVLYPVLAVVFVLVFIASLLLVVRGEVRWKGRRIPLRSR
jgi:4,4'-diaponeurosporenoate glycosyltransferase